MLKPLDILKVATLGTVDSAMDLLFSKRAKHSRFYSILHQEILFSANNAF